MSKSNKKVKKSTTIHDIARELNISSSTVSRSLNNHPGTNSRTKNLVRKTAKKLNYNFNSLASRLRSGRSHTIGLIVPRVDREYFSNVIYAVETYLYERGYHVLICQSNENFEKEKASFQTLLRNNVEGLVVSISAETTDSEIMEGIIARGTPLIQFDRVLKKVKGHKVMNDNFGAAYDAVKHMIDQGYRKIVHYAGPQHINIFEDRFLGYKQALEDYGIPFLPELVIQNGVTKEDGENITTQLFTKRGCADAIFASSDYSALGAMIRLNEMGYTIPDDVGICGYANEPFTELFGLTSIDQFSTEMGKTIAKTLVESIEENDTAYIPKTIIIAPKLIPRKSTLRKDGGGIDN